MAAPEPLTYDDAYLRGILDRVKTIAMVGASMNEMRPSYFAMLYLQGKGFRVIPVNPRYAGQQLLGDVAARRGRPRAAASYREALNIAERLAMAPPRARCPEGMSRPAGARSATAR